MADPDATRHIYYKRSILVSFIILVLAHIVFTFSGFYGSDDINYARYAAGIAENGISFSPATDHFQLRWSTIYSTAFFYKFFGVNEITSCFSSALSFILCGFILHKIMIAKKTVVYLLSMTVFFFAHSVIFYMHRLMPDAIMCLAVLWMYFSYRVFYVKRQNAPLYAAAFGCAFMLGVLTKESIIVVLPLFVIFFARDLYQQQRVQFWKYAIPFSAVLLGMYLCYFKLTTGDYLYRYHLLQQKSYDNICSFDKLPLLFTVKRIGYELWRAMLLNGDFIVLIPAIAALTYGKKMGDRGPAKIDLLSFIVLLLCANFMSISITSYIPLCHDPRHFLFLFPFSAILGGTMLYAYFKEPLKFGLLPLLYFTATIIIFILEAGNTKYLYLLFSLLLIAHYLYSCALKRKLPLYPLVAAFIACTSLNYIFDFVKPPYPFFKDHKKIVQHQFYDNQDSAIVFCADDLSAEISEYLLSFKKGPVKFYPLDSTVSSSNENNYLLVNTSLNPKAHALMDSLTRDRRDSSAGIVKQSNGVILYKVRKSTLIKIQNRRTAF